MRSRLLLAIAFFAAAFLPANPSAAQDEASAKALLTTIFGRYGKGGKGTDYKSGYFHSSLVALVNADVKAAGTDIPAALDGDPVCDCQEWDGIWLDKLDVKLEKPERAIVVASFYIYSPENRSGDDRDRREMRYTLLAERGGWRIYDIEDMSRKFDPKEPRSLRRQLRQDIESFKHESR